MTAHVSDDFGSGDGVRSGDAPDGLVLLDVSGGVGTVTLNRPRQLNALNQAAADQLVQVVSHVASREDIQVVLLTAAGRSFCAGGDVFEMAEAADPSAVLADLVGSVNAAVAALTELDKPIVAAVQGAVAGAGIGVMLTADVIIAADDARFAAGYAKVGLSPDGGTATMVPAAIGLQRALDFYLNARTIGALLALEWGMITEIVDAGELARAAEDRAQLFAAGAASALGQTRRLLRAAVNRELASGFGDEAATIVRQAGTRYAMEAISAFASRVR